MCGGILRESKLNEREKMFLGQTRHRIIPMSGVDINITKIFHTRHPITPVSGVALNIKKKRGSPIDNRPSTN